MPFSTGARHTGDRISAHANHFAALLNSGHDDASLIAASVWDEGPFIGARVDIAPI